MSGFPASDEVGFFLPQVIQLGALGILKLLWQPVREKAAMLKKTATIVATCEGLVRMAIASLRRDLTVHRIGLENDSVDGGLSNQQNRKNRKNLHTFSYRQPLSLRSAGGDTRDSLTIRQCQKADG